MNRRETSSDCWPSDMKILLTGGTGLIGARLCKRFADAGHELTVLSRRVSRVWERLGNTSVRHWRSLEEWAPDVQIDAIINLAGESVVDHFWTDARKKALWNSRVGLTHFLVDRIRLAQRKPSVLLSGSAVGYYGFDDARVFKEADLSGKGFSALLCSEWENAAREAQAWGVRVCLLRTGVVLSSQGGMLEKMCRPARRGVAVSLGSGRQWISWIHEEDYGCMVQRFLEDDSCEGAYNMTAPCPVRERVFSGQLAELMGCRLRVRVPACAIRWGMGERSELLLHGQQVVPGRWVTEGGGFLFPELPGALANLLGDGPFDNHGNGMQR